MCVEEGSHVQRKNNMPAETMGEKIADEITVMISTFTTNSSQFVKNKRILATLLDEVLDSKQDRKKTAFEVMQDTNSLCTRCKEDLKHAGECKKPKPTREEFIAYFMEECRKLAPYHYRETEGCARRLYDKYFL